MPASDPIAPRPAEGLRFGQVWSTWWPLAASWLMMGFELPAVSATIARLPDPEISLAAYGGIVFPVSLLIEAPIIMLLAASTALCRDRASYLLVRRFMLIAGGSLTVLHVAVCLTPLFDLVVVRLLGAPEEIRPAARLGLLILTPWTGSIAVRRFHQGVLIRSGRSRLVGLGTAVRLGTNVSVLAAGWAHGGLSGIAVGAAAVAAGVLAEALFVGIAVRPALRALPETGSRAPLTWPRFLSFYTPLALTSVLALLSLPMGTAAITRLPRAIDSLAVWPVINGLVFTLRSLGFAYHEVVVALLDRPAAHRALLRFARILAGVTSLVLAAIAATPLSRLWFSDVSGLSAPIAELGMAAIWIAIPLPALSALQHWFQGVLTGGGRTRAVGEATGVAIAVAGTALLAGVAHGGIPGIHVCLAAFLLGHLAQVAHLALRARSVALGGASA